MNLKKEQSEDDKDIYEGFDEDGNRIAWILLRKTKPGPVGLYSHFPVNWHILEYIYEKKL